MKQVYGPNTGKLLGWFDGIWTYGFTGIPRTCYQVFSPSEELCWTFDYSLDSTNWKQCPPLGPGWTRKDGIECNNDDAPMCTQLLEGVPYQPDPSVYTC